MSARDVIAAALWWSPAPAANASNVLSALAAAGYAVVPVVIVGAQCPFDNIDHGGLSETDPCPVCGELGRPDGEPVLNCVSGRAMLAAAKEPQA